jgi:hypothetical protein
MSGERRRQDLGPDGRSFINSTWFKIIVAGLLGSGAGGGVSLGLNNTDRETITHLENRLELLEQKFDQNVETSKQFSTLKDSYINQRLDRIEIDIKDIKKILQGK